MSSSLSYHLAELEIVRKLDDPRRSVPQFRCDGWTVLDIGCGIGQTLTAVEFQNCRARHGIDIDGEAIEAGQKMFPDLTLSVSGAEHIPYPDATFDLIFSRVAIPYTNVPVALREIHRTLKPGGQVWLTLHSWGIEKVQTFSALKRLDLRRLLDRTYVLVNSLGLQLFGCCFARPWSGSYESIQFTSGIRRLMKKTGFEEIVVSKKAHFLLTARRSS